MEKMIATTRLESLSDGVFALSIALLLLSTSVPQSYEEMLRFVYDVVPFAICIVFVFWIWRVQSNFLETYSLRDGRIVILNLTLLFLVLFYVYPLKFLMSWLTKYFSSLFGYLVIDASYQEQLWNLSQMIPFQQLPVLMIIYGCGFAGIFLVFLLLHQHIHRQRVMLGLEDREILELHFTIRRFTSIILVALISIFIAAIGLLTGSPIAAFLSGISYNLIWVLFIFNNRKYNRKIKEFEVSLKS